MTWRAEAACRGMGSDVFFPSQGDTAALRAAQAVCLRCPVQEECLEAALEEEAGDLRVIGVRGGMSAKQRRGIRRAKRLAG